MSGFFLVFEGIEGSGKTLQLELLARYLRERGIEPLVTREPGGTKLGEGIRRLLLKDGEPSPHTELFLYLADRAQHVEEVIRPALREGRIVLCDRYYPSTLAYQGYARGLDLGFIEKVNAVATGGLKPHMVVLLDLPVDVALKRIGVRSKDRMEREAGPFHEKVRRGFLEQAQREPDLFHVIDGTKRPEEVFQEVLECIESRFPGKVPLLRGE